MQRRTDGTTDDEATIEVGLQGEAKAGDHIDSRITRSERAAGEERCVEPVGNRRHLGDRLVHHEVSGHGRSAGEQRHTKCGNSESDQFIPQRMCGEYVRAFPPVPVHSIDIQQ